jgi:hypothetical protein
LAIEEENAMKTIKVSLVALAILILGTAHFDFIVQAAEVIRINKSKGLVVIDGSKADGFVMGATVCFYNTSGEKISCGRIQQTSASYATVKIDNREVKKIRNGTEARLSAEITDCVDDSGCDDNEGCVNGKCRRKTEKKGCVDDSECGDGGVCINGKCVSR